MNRCAPALALAALCAAPVPAIALEFGPAFVMRAAHSLVRIEAERPQRGVQIGTGVVIAQEHVTTACHVLRDATSIHVLYTGRRWKASALRAMPERDVCVIRVPSLDAPPARVRSSGELKIGEPVIAVGFGGGAGIQWSEGTVEELHRFDSAEIIRTSAAFTSGASGGALFDSTGRLVGVLSFRMRGPGAQFFCVPTEWAAQELEGADAGASVDTRFKATPFWARQVDALPFFMRASTLETEQRWEELRALCKAWRLAEPLNAEPALVASAVESRFGRFSAARAALEEAVALDPNHALAWSELVRIRLRLQDVIGARDAYARVAALSANLARVLLEEQAALRTIGVD